jgi:hypothetical protein
MDEVAPGPHVDPDAMQANMDATEGAVLGRARDLPAGREAGKQKAGQACRGGAGQRRLVF